MNELTFTEADVLRSLGTAVVLCLNDKDPFSEYGDAPNLPHSDGRIAVVDNGQTLPLFPVGAFGEVAYPAGISIEAGEAKVDFPSKNYLPVIVSVSREIKRQPEVELVYLENLLVKVRRFIYQDRKCPIYQFETGDTISGTRGMMFWGGGTANLPVPRHKIVNQGMMGGAIRKEFRFTLMYTTFQIGID